MDALLPWQRPQWERLWQSQTQNRLGHALLLTGPAGVGKTAFARRFSQALLCAAALPDHTPCGQCHSCRLFQAGSHPDYLAVTPAEPGKPIKVDQVRDLNAFLGFTSQFSGRQIVQVQPAEAMNINAANSLLKTLEEPTPGSLLLLLSAAPNSLPATVRSRCQKVNFAVPPPAEARDWLTAHCPGQDAGLLLNLTGGAPLKALAYAGDDALTQRRALFRVYLDTLTGKLDPVQAAAHWQATELARTVDWLLGWHEDMIRLILVPTPPYLPNSDFREPLHRLASRFSRPALLRRLDDARQLRRLLSDTQVNSTMALEAFFSASLADQDMSRR